MHVGRDASGASLGWSLLHLTVIIVLALVNSTVSQRGTLSISTRPVSAALLPVRTASTGLLHLLVGTHVHCVRSDTGKYHMWPLLCTHHFQCVTYILTTCTCVTHQMWNMHGGSHAFHFSIASTTMHTGTNQKAQQSCGSGTDREWGSTPGSC